MFNAEINLSIYTCFYLEQWEKSNALVVTERRSTMCAYLQFASVSGELIELLAQCEFNLGVLEGGERLDHPVVAHHLNNLGRLDGRRHLSHHHANACNTTHIRFLHAVTDAYTYK